MAEERIVDKLRKGERILCPVCKKSYIDNKKPNREFSNYFHCENEKCSGSVHEQKVIDVD